MSNVLRAVSSVKGLRGFGNVDEFIEMTRGKRSETDLPESLRQIDGLSVFDPASVCGIYFLCNREEVLYVGQSINTVYRHRSHKGQSRIPFDRIGFLQLRREMLDAVERDFINTLKPRFNKTYNPNRNALTAIRSDGSGSKGVDGPKRTKCEPVYYKFEASVLRHIRPPEGRRFTVIDRETPGLQFVRHPKSATYPKGKRRFYYRRNVDGIIRRLALCDPDGDGVGFAKALDCSRTAARNYNYLIDGGQNLPQTLAELFDCGHCGRREDEHIGVRLSCPAGETRYESEWQKVKR